jgi:ubiquitin-like protein Pup
MADQTRKGKPTKEKEAAPREEKAAESKASDVDELLDEIDEVLETNAEEFVRSYIQKGGEAIVPLTQLPHNRWLAALLIAGILIARHFASRPRTSKLSHLSDNIT